MFDLNAGRIRDGLVVVGTPLTNKHHFTIRAVPDAAGAADASNEATPDTTRSFDDTHDTDGPGLLVVNVKTLDVAVRPLESVTVHCNVCAPGDHAVVSHRTAADLKSLDG
jgi:hypothetical protein